MVKEYTDRGQKIRWTKIVAALIDARIRAPSTTPKSVRGAWERRSAAGKSWSDAIRRTPDFKCKFCGEWKLGHICKAAVNNTTDAGQANRMSALRALRDKLQKECDELEASLAFEQAQHAKLHIAQNEK